MMGGWVGGWDDGWMGKEKMGMDGRIRVGIKGYGEGK